MVLFGLFGSVWFYLFENGSRGFVLSSPLGGWGGYSRTHTRRTCWILQQGWLCVRTFNTRSGSDLLTYIQVSGHSEDDSAI